VSLTDTAPRETTLEAGGHAKGVAVAIVRENKDDSGLGRVKVSFPWFSEAQESYWARVATPMAGKKHGIYFMPEVGDEVLVAFERGDLRFPYVVGSLWNGVDPAPETNADGKNTVRVIHSRDDHKITIKDDRAQPLLQIELADGKRITLDRDGIEIDDKQGNTFTMASASGSITVQASTSITFKAPRITMDANAAATVKAAGTVTVQGALVKIN
jgi:uncharacterized protein involved in type VI secretion and phage assembly